jgi:hypothetical protein
MARLFILFLIALLPLRGWTAERMVIQMERGAPVSVQAMDSAVQEDCALHMQTAQMDSDHTAPDASHGPDHKGCQNCQLCMPLAGLHAAMPLALAAIPQALPRTHSSRFVSADPAQGVKPPIS